MVNSDFNVSAYQNSLNTLILKDLLDRGYENTKINAGLDNINVENFDEINQKYFAFKIGKGTSSYHHPSDSKRAVHSIVDVIQATLLPDKTLEMLVCKVELVKPYNLFSEAVKGVVRYRILKNN